MIFTLGTDNMFVTFDFNTVVGYNSDLKVLMNNIFHTNPLQSQI